MITPTWCSQCRSLVYCEDFDVSEFGGDALLPIPWARVTDRVHPIVSQVDESGNISIVADLPDRTLALKHVVALVVWHPIAFVVTLDSADSEHPFPAMYRSTVTTGVPSNATATSVGYVCVELHTVLLGAYPAY